jgi:penicillin-binding protein 1A
MSSWLRIPLRLLTLAMMLVVAVAALLTGGYFYVEPTIPKAEELRDFRAQTPLRIFSRDGRLMAQYGEYKRAPMAFDLIPQRIKDGCRKAHRADARPCIPNSSPPPGPAPSLDPPSR